MDDCLAITLLRHGMTGENAKGAYIGWTDAVLSDEGKKAVYAIREQIPYKELLFSSDLSRCMATAKVIFPDQYIQPLTELREMNFGAWEGKTYDALKELEDYRKWLDDPFHVVPNGGESFTSFSGRIEMGFSKVVEEILDNSAKGATIVTHGGVIRYLLTKYSGMGHTFFEWKIPYAHGYELIWGKESLRRRKACMSLRVVPIMEKRNG